MLRALNLTTFGHFLLALFMVSPGWTGAQETDNPQFRSETTLVVVDAIVTDKKGHIVSDLKASDFKIFENGAEQKIAEFSAPSKGEVAAPSPRQATIQAGSSLPPRFLTVVLDMANDKPENVKRSCEAVLQYLAKAGTGGTQVAVYYTGRGLHLLVPFTTDYSQAESALKGLAGQNGTGTMTVGERRSIQQEIDELYDKAHPEARLGGFSPNVSDYGRAAPTDPFAAAYLRQVDALRTYLSLQNTYQTRDLLVALRSIANSYRDLPGRKNIVLFSEGFPYTAGASAEMDAVIAAADKANVSFYVIDPSGLQSRIGLESDAGNTLNTQTTDVAMQGAGAYAGETKFDRMRQLGNQSLTEQLDQLAISTGGFLVKNLNDLNPAFARILAETSSFYVLTYHPTNPLADGTFRNIKLQVQRDGLELRHRKGYWAIPQGHGVMMSPAAAQLLASVRSGAVKTSFQVPVAGALMPAADGSYYLPVSVAVASVLATGKAGPKSPPLTIIAVAYDANGSIVSAYEKEWRLAAETAQQPITLTLQGQLPISSPQRLRLDVLLRSPGGSYGAGSANIAMPGSPDPQLSSVVVTTEIELTECADPSEALCVGNIRVHLPADPTFTSAGRMVAVIAAGGLALDSTEKKPRVGAVFTVKRGDKVLGSIPEQNLQAIPGKHNEVWLIGQLPLKGLAEGAYSLEVTAKDFVTGKATTSSAVFEVK